MAAGLALRTLLADAMLSDSLERRKPVLRTATSMKSVGAPSRFALLFSAASFVPHRGRVSHCSASDSGSKSLFAVFFIPSFCEGAGGAAAGPKAHGRWGHSG